MKPLEIYLTDLDYARLKFVFKYTGFSTHWYNWKPNEWCEMTYDRWLYMSSTLDAAIVTLNRGIEDFPENSQEKWTLQNMSTNLKALLDQISDMIGLGK